MFWKKKETEIPAAPVEEKLDIHPVEYIVKKSNPISSSWRIMRLIRWYS